MSRLSYQQAIQIMSLRTIIARAGQKDSLRWWEDESFTTDGRYILDRVFPGSSILIARNLTLAAASARHQTALAELGDTAHLFRVSDENVDQLAMRDLSRHIDENMIEPITSIEVLRQRLLSIIGDAPQYETKGILSQHRGLRIKILPATDIVQKANALAWAYLEGTIENPIFPYFGERNHDY